ncbi:phage tail protein [Burkholderia multivorans]|uniref:phage tail protein n=1 Tax=Burkholderia multivorans TaxID=87883 RepID=UPI0013DF9374|nr:phage tail protein [Burkholderia multivorans]MDN7970397.1 tail fiber protein [Burkholderia multivorans]NGM78011.1 phage tail protein [Burkholderia multivorans]
MAGNLINITDAGRAALVAASNTGTVARRVTEVGLGTAAFTFDKGMKTMPAERKRVTTFGGENVAPDTVHVVIQDDTDDQYSLFAYGLYLDNGVLFGVYVQDTPILEKSPAAMMLLASDIVFKSIDASQLQFGPATFLNPPATTDRKGVVELATTEEVAAGTDATRAVTPATLKPRLDAKANLSGADFTGRISTRDVLHLASAPGGTGAILSAGNGDGASASTTNVALRSWYGIGFAPTIDGMPVPRTEFSHWFDTRTGNTGFRGTLDVGGLITAQTPPSGDASKRVPTTEWVVAAIASAGIGTIVFEPRTSVRAGFLKLNGALVNRSDYPALWAYAQASGALVAESAWGQNNWGCFSTGDGATTFRLPELRGEFLRCWDDGRGADSARGIGTFQSFQNAWHAHGASSAAVGDHTHGAWTDAQGWHGHHGWTGGGGGHNHNNGIFSRLLRPPYGGSLTGSDQAGSGSEQAVGAGDSADIAWSGDHAHEFNTEGSGTHSHNVGIGGAGAHAHAITVNGDGGNEARPRNIAMLAMIRAY